MATKNPRLTPTRSVRVKHGFVRAHRLVSFIFILAIVVAATGYGLYVHNQHALKADKARFLQAESDISSLSKEIIAVTGQPLKVDNKKFCSRPHLTYERGPLSCDVDVTYFFSVDDESQATLMYNNVNTILQATWLRSSIKFSGTKANSTVFQTIDSKNYVATTDYQQIYEFYNLENKDLQCNAVYNFYLAESAPYPEYVKSDVSKYILAVRLSCSDYAKQEYYPLNN